MKKNGYFIKVLMYYFIIKLLRNMLVKSNTNETIIEICEGDRITHY